MDGKKFRTYSQIFKKVDEKMKLQGYTRTHTQVLDKFRAMKKQYMAVTKALSINDAGTEMKAECPYFDKLHDMFGHRPTMNRSGADSTILVDSETSGYYASDAEVSQVTSRGCSGSQKRKSVGCTGGYSSLSPSTSSGDEKSSSNGLRHPSRSVSPTLSCSSEDRRSTVTPLLDGASSAKKPKICRTPTNRKREGPRFGLNVMHEFAEQIIESQEKLLSQTLKEQERLDKEMLEQYNNIFLQQTQMLLTGLRNWSCPLPTNYPILQQLPVVPTVPSINPMMFTETPQRQPNPPPVLPRRNDNIIVPSTSTQHDTHTHPKPHQTEKEVHRLTVPSQQMYLRKRKIYINQPLCHEIKYYLILCLKKMTTDRKLSMKM